MAEIGGSIENMLLACRGIVKLHMARREFPDIKEKLDQIEILAAEFQSPPIVMERINGLRSMLALNEGNTQQAKTWAYAFSSKNEHVKYPACNKVNG